MIKEIERKGDGIRGGVYEREKEKWQKVAGSVRKGKGDKVNNHIEDKRKEESNEK